MSSAVAAADYLAAFRARREYCRALLELSQRQQALIAAEDYPGLIDLLAHKQELVDALLDGERPAADLVRAWRQDRARLPEDVRRNCDEALAEAERLLQELLSAESCSTELLTHRRNDTAAALCAVNQSGQALAAYRTDRSIPTPTRLDVNL